MAMTLNGTNGIVTPAGLTINNAPAFAAYKNAGNQSITASTFTKITFDTELYDTNNNFASSTFTPTVAGYYQINATVYMNATAQTLALIAIYKNGSAYGQGNQFYGTLSGSSGCVISDIIYMNGSTDYIDIYGYSTGTSPNVGNGQATCRVSGSLVRSA